MRHMRRLRSISLLSADHLVRAALGFLVSVLLARHLGPEGFGAYAYLWSIIAILAPFTVFGLEQVGLRHLVTSPARQHEILGSALALRLAGALVGVVLASIAVALLGGPVGASPELGALAALLLLFMPSEAINGVFKARERMAWIAAPRVAVSCIAAAVTAAAVIVGGVLQDFVAIRVAEAAVAAAGTLLALRLADGVWPRFTVDRALVRSLVREGWPIFLSSLTVIIYMRIDQVMLGSLSAAAELGYYSVAVRITEALLFVPMAMSAAYYAGLVDAFNTGPSSAFEREVSAYYDVAGLSAWATAVLVALAARVVLVPGFGEAYAPAVPMAYILAGSIVFASIGVARTTILTIRGWVWTPVITTAAGALVNLLLNFLLIPAYGGIGAAIATLVSYWLAAHGMCFLLPWMRPTGMTLLRAMEPIGASRRLVARRYEVGRA